MTTGSPPGPAPSVGAVVRRRRPALVLSAALAVTSAAAGLVPYVAVYLVAVELFGGGAPDPGRVPVIAGWTAVALLVKAAAGALSAHVAHLAAYGALADLRLALVGRLDRIPLGRAIARPAGELKKTLHDDVEQLEEALAHGVPDVVAAAAVPVATTALLFAVDWRLGLLAFLALVLLLLIGGIASALARRSSAEQMASMTELNRTVVGFLDGMKVVRAFRRVDGDDRLTGALDRAVHAGDAPLRSPVRWLASALMVATGLPIALLLPVAGAGFVEGRVDLATLALFLLLGLGYATPLIAFIGTLATLGYRVQMATAGIGALLAEPELPAPERPRSPQPGPAGPDVEFDGVTFGYDPDRPVLTEVDLLVPAGRVTALVGPTGAGKSTLARLVARFADVTAGAVRIGGVDVRDIAPDELARLVSVVGHDDHVFDASVLENIRIGRPDATDDEVREAGRSARVDEFADALPQGWDTTPGSGGVRFSGGQRQRISVARALLKASPVVVLDEATAFLDAENERATLAAVRELARGRTVLVVAHRLQTVVDADAVVVVDGGRILAAGPHAELVGSSPRYRALWNAYQDGAGWRLAAAETDPSSDTAGRGGAAGPVDAAGSGGGAGAVGAAGAGGGAGAVGAAGAGGGAGAAGAAGAGSDGTRGRVAAAAPGGAAGAAVAAGAVGAAGSAGAAAAAPLNSGDPDGRAWSAAAAGIVRPGVAGLSFPRQWVALLGRWWPRLRGAGAVRLMLEGLFRGAPVAAVYLVLLAAVQGTLTTGTVAAVSTALVVLLAVRLLANNAANQLVWRIATRAKVDLQLSMLDRLRSVPLGTLSRLDNGRITTTVANDTVMLDFQNTPQQIAGAVITPLYATVVLLLVDWRLALATLAGVPLFAACTVLSDRVYRQVMGPVGEARSAATSRLLDHVRGTAVLRAYPGSAVALRYRDAVEDLRRTSIAMSVRATPAVALGSVALELGLVALIVTGATLYAAGGVGAGTLLLFLVLSLVLYQPLGEIAALAGYRRTQQQIARRIAEIWEQPVLPEPSAPAVAAGTDVELHDVGFRYDGSGGGLHGVSLRAAAGTVTALVGPSGAGKSTVANLVARFWDVDSGSVRIGGADLRELGSAGATALVTTVFQDVYLFPGTVRENLTPARPGATDEEIAAALAAADCTDVVDALPDGLDTVLGEGGADLSGGQRQRLSIARALLKDAPVLVLDEAVASVDAETEVRIQQALSRLARGRTVIVVAHRLSTVRAADHIAVLDGGRIDAAGTHDELVETSPVYRRLLAASAPAAPLSTITGGAR
ncbi:ABC transporter ATP-binding protein [Pseudonocardia saturnea]|uniref:ABC transporter ATP-binding protein n=1 Tax=Pseudonocardia saturnea TaxID=33909 RepID=UPI001143D262|nr:ABC transporter ATP-binding protein [Pseudonocardia saturnea]